MFLGKARILVQLIPLKHRIWAMFVFTRCDNRRFQFWIKFVQGYTLEQNPPSQLEKAS